MTAALRVLDLTDPLAHHAARVLVGTGADVLRVERPDAPVVDEASDLHWHAGKRVVTVRSEEEYDEVVARLAAGADVVLESGPLRRIRTLCLRAADPSAWARVAHVVVTPFGPTGPRRDWLAGDLVLTAAGGMAWLGGDPGEAPEPPPRDQAGQLAGAHAAIGALLALVARRRTGRGQLVEISAQEAVAATLETGAISWIHAQSIPGRTSGVYGHVAHRVFAAADGHVAGGYSGSPRMWDDLLAWMVEEGEAEDLDQPVWDDVEHRWKQRPHVDEVVARFAARRTTAEIAEQALARALPWAEVVPPARLAENPQLADRRFPVTIDTPRGELHDVGFPFESPGLPRPVRLGPPRRAATTVAWLAAPARVLEPSRPTAPEQGPGALAGVRVLDLTWVLAGPYVTKILGEHGADIVKVESSHRKDPTRFAPGMRLRPGASYDDSGYFLNFNRNKRSLALNLRTPRGQELLRALVPHVDLVVENFSPGVLARWDLAYDQVRALNQRVVLVSMAGVGQDGPWRSAVTFADTLSAMSGLTSETGRQDRAPQGLTFGLGDMVAANAAVAGALELLHAGVGGHLDLSQLEAMAANLGPAALEAQLGAQASPGVVPTVVRTRGADRWLAVGDCPPEQLRAALSTLAGTTAPVSSADTAAALRALAADHDADELAGRLQLLGIPAHPVRDGRDLVESDPQLTARGFYAPIEHPIAGPVRHEGVVEHLHETPGGLWRPAPLLGEHTDELLTELLGLSGPELADLHEEGILS
ncbi:CoA transferase [Nocardioides sp. YIM 152315]|uniref:CaiB/BaiF CoA-transferase family protein n=1 Tax=Nocardioides sp. YIM 152315 TaxID=3031760 RepID=UPI0023DC6862|nr:CoA transferase [Nocardioides sp. YIM 152315]MDF1604500.1 CoA transferase [Nocardioides sp. YIM 152315]